MPGRRSPRSVPGPGRATWLEIGFGGGEHLAAQARAHPDVGFIGCEPFVNGMAKLLAAIEQDGLATSASGTTTTRPAADAARRLASTASTSSTPIPGRSAASASAASSSDETARRARPRACAGGELRFATDIDDYVGWALARILRSPDFRWTASAPTIGAALCGLAGHPLRGEGHPRGRVPTYLTFERVYTAAQAKRGRSQQPRQATLASTAAQAIRHA